jgi:hypothetical protein
MKISTRWSMVLRCCFRRLFASLSTWLACQRRAQRPRLTTPRLPPRPSRRNNGIGPKGATSLAGPLATITKLQWLELRYCPLAACGGVALGGREAGRRGNAVGLGAREGGNTLRFATTTSFQLIPQRSNLGGPACFFSALRRRETRHEIKTHRSFNPKQGLKLKPSPFELYACFKTNRC